MQFTVPQFIEKETKIFLSFTFKQLIIIGIAGAIAIFLYFTLLSKSLFLFLLLAGLVMGTGFILALLKPGGVPLPTVMARLFLFLFKPKIYLWRKKTLPARIAQKKDRLEKEVKEEPILKIAEKSHLKDLFTRLEVKTK